ncbi:hypothetical protein O181_047161 [Austropuccinia psidii MF-1]|uniref:H/ACA ribonucleoprotein complex subunit n=1 Tax=Austropuccinia psidii MF-1 TaxID=1389203 RepID=A0A9Q3HJ97_9BASI|nr:hypothetical protein [Austropuccinia psidii MF-1]
MSSRGGFRGSDRGNRGGRGRGGGGFRGNGGFDNGPPAEVLEIGSFVLDVEGEMLCSSTNLTKIPYFNAPIYLANKTAIGKVDEILGPVNQVFFTIKMGEGMIASSFECGDKVYIGSDKLLPVERFLPKPPGEKIPKRGGGGRGGRGGSRGGPRGGGRGAPRGGGRGFSRGGGAGGSRGFSRGGFRGGAGGRGHGFSGGRGGGRGRGY